ncbi:NAD(P)-dependent alcohol dehydrogenase [Kineococcus arenarius]|uniref:NAD(P)-dependent alcohol dehydrogenase n=1 Tax=unclassified Kineococcus TaxID=2621656 RepID=UPI003D7DC8B1
MTTSASAAVLHGENQPFVVEDVVLDDPRPDEVLVRVVAAGVCGTDLGVVAGHIPFPLPGVLGHEGAGVVEAVGDAVTTVRPGDKVLMTFTSCGTCPNCLTGHPAYCEAFMPRNLLDGSRADGSATVRGSAGDLHGSFFAQSSFATHVLADERSVTVVSPDADLSTLAPLGCGVQTGAGTVFNVLQPTPGSSIAVLGAGAVGLSAVMAAALTGATTIVVADLVDSRLELARELGATHTINSGSEDLEARLHEITGGRGVAGAVETTGSARVLEAGIRSLAYLGTLAVVGAPAPGTTASFDVTSLLNGRRIVGVTEGDSNPKLLLPALVDLVLQGRFPLEKLIRQYPFAQINEAAAAARDGSVLKPVLTFG